MGEGGAAVGIFLGCDARCEFAGLEDMRMGFVDGLAETEVTGGNGGIAAMLG